MADEKMSDVEISCTGIDLLVNNDWDGCEKLFAKYKDQSPLTNYCHSFLSFVKAVMTFEDQQLEIAQKNIENTEKLCSESTKMFSSLKKAFKFSSSSSLNKKAQEKGDELSKEKILEDKFSKAIILADCKLYLAILTFVRQEVSGYFTNGILQIRKSWKLYSKIHKQLYSIYKKLEPNAEQIYGSDPNASVIQLWIEENDESSSSDSKNQTDKTEEQINEAINELTVTDEEASTGISVETVRRLLGAVSFGYGLFQICLSFMSPNVLKLIKVFGFEGDRSVAIKAINFTSNSKDMRAPFADMVLLWYSTTATPLFGIGEGDVIISNEDTKLMLDKNLNKYPKSSLFYYLKGKYCRSILKDLNGSLLCYEQAAEYSNHIREIQLISVYEIGWIHLTNLNYAQALEKFLILHKDSKWSKSFSTYICAILSASLGNFSQANQYIKDAVKLIASQTRKLNPIELFAQKRCEFLKKNSFKTKSVGELLVIELLYLWVCLPFTTEENLKKMALTCEEINEKNLTVIKCLIEGAIYMSLNNKEFGEQCFNECLARGENEKVTMGKYALACANLELALYNMELKEYNVAKSYLNKAQTGYKEFELEDRIQTMIKSAQRRLKHVTDGDKLAATLKARSEAEEQERLKKQADIKNFYVS
ncbi:unnamed protein product [Brachionus calyciflorus]|uniref:Tetratricopeptide repeat protein 39C n=1 Tax=Brachionus calyciflorus TaxID=104777 RepID=A0A813M061_9BILA|nr:unnamed protein product [Brachionus calyciflorus]